MKAIHGFGGYVILIVFKIVLNFSICNSFELNFKKYRIFYSIEMVFLEGTPPQNISGSFYESLPIAKNSMFLTVFKWEAPSCRLALLQKLAKTYTRNISLRLSSAVPLDMTYMTAINSLKLMVPSRFLSYMLKILLANLSQSFPGKHLPKRDLIKINNSKFKSTEHKFRSVGGPLKIECLV